MRGRLPHFRGGKWPPYVLALLTFAALTVLLLHGLWGRQRAAAAPPSGNWQAAWRGPTRMWWQTRDLGIFRYDFAGTAMDGEAVVVRVWLKAVKQRQEVLMQAVMWSEPAIAILQHKKRGYLQQPEQAYADALSKKGFLRLRATGSGTSYVFAVGKVAQAGRLIRPLTFSLRLRSTDILEDRFELRLEGWRKFHMVALSDLLASADSIDSGSSGSGHAEDGSIGADNFFVVSPRLTAHANATHAAKLTAQHIAHHRQLGFSGHSVFLNREHAGAFMAHPELAAHIQEGRLWLISEDFGMARVAVGAASNDSDRHGASRLESAKKRGELDFSHRALTYAIAQLRHWDGRRRNFITVLDAAEFMVCDRGSIQDVASACFRSAGMVLLPLMQTDCGRPGGCGTADDPAAILRASDRGRVGTARSASSAADSKPAWRAMALAGAVSGYFLDQGVPEQGLSTQRLGEEGGGDRCRAHVVQFNNLLSGPRSAESSSSAA